MVRWGLLLLCVAAAAYAAPTCLVDEQLRQDCGFIGITQGECESRGCCWNPASSGSSFPWCFHLESRDCGSYVVTGTSQPAPGVTELFLDYAGTRCNYYGPEIEALKVIVTTERDFMLHVKIVDRTAARWEVPETVIPRKDRVVLAPSPQYRFGYVSQPFGFFVQRSDTGEVIFNTTASSSNPQFRNLVFENQYLEISTQLPSGANVYGIGERRFPLRLQEDRQYPIWTADELTPFQENNYGSHPFYVENRNGKAHGVLLLNSNGMDVDLGKGFLRYRVIGGIFDFYFFLGPSPNAVVSQYLDLVGKPYFMPYWSLGFHQCRWGYKNIETVAEVVSKYRESNIPLETMWTDIDYMNGYRDWTFDPIDYPVEKVRAFVDELHKNKQHYILITDPGIKNESGYYYYDFGRELDVFLKDASGDDFVGRVWPGNTVFPDFFHPRSYEYWKKSIDDFLKLVSVDGLWVDMNEVANFCNGFCDDKHRSSSKRESGKPKKEGFDPNNPPYQINNRLEHLPLNFKTTDMDVTHYGGILEYDAHNLYGTMEVIATKQALEEITKKRAFVLSRSTFSGSGHHGGHWTGDNFAEWEHLYHSIPAMLNLNIFGIPYVGADICGFASSTTEELCARWMQLGAFYPFSRNHNNDNSISQEPYLWESVAEVSRIALRIRYSILSYYYTLFYIASTEGSTVVRPLFFEFPTDPALADNDRQFLLGDAILFSPVLTQGATSVEAYFPAGRWYDFYTHAFADYKEGTTKVLDAPLEKINIHVREGKVITLQNPAYSTAETKLSDYTLVVALSQTGSASGQLYLDDGESLNVGDDQSTFVTYTASTTAGLGRLVSTGRHNYPATNKIERVEVLGISGSVSQVRVGGAAVPFEFNAAIGKLTVPNLAVSFLSLTLEWQ